MSDLLQEFCDSRGLALRVDQETGLIRGIKVLGPRSRNAREYLPEALSRAVGLYEGAKVNVNHPKGHPLAPRDYQERIGVIRNVQLRAGEGLFADFHFNPKHYLSEQLIWDAEHAPENVGFSHNVQARTSRRGETTLVEEILEVHSVDLVADPATTRGLFEERDELAPSDPRVSENPGETGVLPAAATLGEQESDSLQTLCEQQAAEIAKLRHEIDQLRAQEAAKARRELVRALLAEYRLPDPDSAGEATKVIVSETFIQSLLAAPDEMAARRLVENRARLVGYADHWNQHSRAAHGQPISRDQLSVDQPTVVDGKSFARAIAG